MKPGCNQGLSLYVKVQLLDYQVLLMQGCHERSSKILVVAEYTSQHCSCCSQAEQIKFLLLLLTAALQLFSFYSRRWFWSVNLFTVCSSWRGDRL